MFNVLKTIDIFCSKRYTEYLHFLEIVLVFNKIIYFRKDVGIRIHPKFLRITKKKKLRRMTKRTFIKKNEYSTGSS